MCSFHGLSTTLPLSLSPGKTRAGGEQRGRRRTLLLPIRRRRQDILEKSYLKKTHPPSSSSSPRCGAAEEEIKTSRMCVRKRSGYRPPDLFNAKIVSIWSACDPGGGWGEWGSNCFCFQFEPPACVPAGLLLPTLLWTERLVSVIPLPPPTSSSPLSPPSLLQQCVLVPWSCLICNRMNTDTRYFNISLLYFSF